MIRLNFRVLIQPSYCLRNYCSYKVMKTMFCPSVLVMTYGHIHLKMYVTLVPSKMERPNSIVIQLYELEMAVAHVRGFLGMHGNHIVYNSEVMQFLSAITTPRFCHL